MYLNVGNELDMDDRSYLDSGSIYISCKKLKLKDRCCMRAARGKQGDIIIHTDDWLVREVGILPSPCMVFNMD